MNSPSLESRLAKVLEGTLASRLIFGAALSVACPRLGFEWHGGAGNLGPDHPHFIASTTKLAVTALILQLRHEGVLRLEDPIVAHLDAELLRGLHVLQGKDRTGDLTIRHLLAHTSGLPDYFQARRSDGKSLLEELTSGTDIGWTFEDTLEATRRLRPLFPPGQPGKAHYSDTNFQLLGRIIENRTGLPLREAMQQRIFARLELKQTYLYTDPLDSTPVPIHFKASTMHIPRAMASFGADGGIVSTAREGLQFIRAFFQGDLFPASDLPELQNWNPIFFPLKSGVGLHLFRLPWIFSPFRRFPDLIGHSGLSGAFQFHCPEKDLYLAGTVNQTASPDRSFRLMLRTMAEF